MLKIVGKISSARGWRRRLIAFLAGSFGALALAPYDFVPAMFVPMMAAVWLLDDPPAARKTSAAAPASDPAKILRWRGKAGLLAAFDSGWWWGFGYFLAGLWWLGAAFLVDADEFAWALPFGVLGLPALLAFFPAAGFACARIFWSPGLGRTFALATGLGLSEWLRGHLFTGFPWNLYGMALGGDLLFAQASSVTGIYGLTIAAIIIFCLPALMFKGGQDSVNLKPLLISIGALASLAAFGWSRVSLPEPEAIPGVRIRIMQPNQPQNAEFRPENGLRILARYIELSERKSTVNHLGLEGTALLIWPESAFPFILSQSPRALAAIYSFLPFGTTLVTGAAREEFPKNQGDSLSTLPAFYNSILVLSEDRDLIENYDKVHLVPFGEYLPLEALLKRLGLHNLIHIPGGFTAGEEKKLLSINGLPPIIPLICYEALFSGDVVPRNLNHINGEQPGLLLNVTDDSWFGQTNGPYQHFSQARLRAVEEGLPMLRAADTGISAIIDPYGRILSMLPLGEAGILDGPVPRALPPTFFHRCPFEPAFLFLVTTLIAAIILKSKQPYKIHPV